MHLTIYSARNGEFLQQISMFFSAGYLHLASLCLSLLRTLSPAGGKPRKETEMEIFTWQAKLSWEPTPTNWKGSLHSCSEKEKKPEIERERDADGKRKT